MNSSLFFVGFFPHFRSSLKLEAETGSCSRRSLIRGGQMKTRVFQIIITLWKPITIHLSVSVQMHLPLQHKNLNNNNKSIFRWETNFWFSDIIATVDAECYSWSLNIAISKVTFSKGISSVLLVCIPTFDHTCERWRRIVNTLYK